MIEQEKIALAQQLVTWFIQGDSEAVEQSVITRKSPDNCYKVFYINFTEL